MGDTRDRAGTRKEERHSFIHEGSKVRLDAWLVEKLPDLSRARIQSLIRDGHVQVNGSASKPSHAIHNDDRIDVAVPPPAETRIEPEDIPLDALYEDNDILVINKPAGLVVHPAPGHDSGTLVNALLHHCKDPDGGTSLGGIGGELRPGIVHRLDKDTSGVLVVAKNDKALSGLQAQFKRHDVTKEYAAIVWGCPAPETGTIDTLVGRNPHNRKKMSAKPQRGRRAVTHYRVVSKFAETSLLSVRIETGRTHQIRVHLAYAGYPVVGDRQYGRARKTRHPVAAGRQMLHAKRLSLRHPCTGMELELEAPLPEDMRNLLRDLEASNA